MKNHKMCKKEQNSTPFFELGLVVTIGLLLVAFNWNSKKYDVKDFGIITDVVLEQEIIQTTVKEKIKPPPPPPKKVAIEELIIVENKDKQTIGNINTEYNPKEPEATTIALDPIPEEEELEPFVQIPEIDASFPGGKSALANFIRSNIRYPKQAKENLIEGRVTIRFKVNTRGTISEIEILRSPDDILSNEAIRMLMLMPHWLPAQQGNRKVSTKVILPIAFTLAK